MVTGKEIINAFCYEYRNFGIAVDHSIHEWTRRILPSLTKLGESLGYYTTSERSLAWLSDWGFIDEPLLKKFDAERKKKNPKARTRAMRPDLLWLEHGNRVKHYNRVALVCESENWPNQERIRSSLRKMQVVKADVKLMICYQPDTNWVEQTVASCLFQKEQNIGHRRWFAIIVDDYTEGDMPKQSNVWFLLYNRKGKLVWRGIAKTEIREGIRIMSRPKWYRGKLAIRNSEI